MKFFANVGVNSDKRVVARIVPTQITGGKGILVPVRVPPGEVLAYEPAKFLNLCFVKSLGGRASRGISDFTRECFGEGRALLGVRVVQGRAHGVRVVAHYGVQKWPCRGNSMIALDQKDVLTQITPRIGQWLNIISQLWLLYPQLLRFGGIYYSTYLMCIVGGFEAMPGSRGTRHG